jgi:hypothetical protein
MPRNGLRSNTQLAATITGRTLLPPQLFTPTSFPPTPPKSRRAEAASSASLPSPLLALPPEVRLNIYRHALQGRLVLFDQVHRHWEDCYQIHYYDDFYDEYADTFKWSAGLCNLSRAFAYDTDENGFGRRGGSPTIDNRLKIYHYKSVPTWQLLCTYRQVYFEALPVFYQLIKFSFSSPRHFWNFYVRIDKNAPLLEDFDETLGWYNTSMETEEVSRSGRTRSKSPKPHCVLGGSFIPLEEYRATDQPHSLCWPARTHRNKVRKPKYLTL